MTSVRTKRLVVLVALFAAGIAFAARVPPGTNDEIKDRLKPFGEICKQGQTCGQAAVAGGGGLGLDGEQVYNQFCFACHLTGVGGAPKLGNADEWAPRVAKGMDALWQTVLNGINTMPPRGTCMACSEDELRAAMTFMLDKAK